LYTSVDMSMIGDNISMH